MKTPVTHGKPDTRGFYTISAGKVYLGLAQRSPDGFQFSPSDSSHIESYYTARTMKELKEKVAKAVPAEKAAEIDALNERIAHPTIRDAITLCGLSHAGVREFLKEIRTFHPEMHKLHQGGYMIRRHMENICANPTLDERFPWARRWLQEHPKTGTYRYVSPAEWEAQARLA